MHRTQKFEVIRPILQFPECPTINSLQTELLEKYKYVLLQFAIHRHSSATDINFFPPGTQPCWPCIVNIIVDGLATNGARSSAGIVLTQYKQNIPQPAWEGLSRLSDFVFFTDTRGWLSGCISFPHSPMAYRFQKWPTVYSTILQLWHCNV